MKTTEKEVVAAIEELKDATIAHLKIETKIEKLEQERIACRKRLSIAREEVRALTMNY